MNEDKKRSAVKALSWRVIATLTTMMLVFIFTREMYLALGVGMVDVILKSLSYYLHERVWDRISWGRVGD